MPTLMSGFGSGYAPKDFRKQNSLDKPHFGQKVIGPTTGYIDDYTPRYPDATDWENVLPTPAAPSAEYRIGKQLPNPAWARLPQNQDQWAAHNLRRPEDQKELFNLLLPMARIDSVCREEKGDDTEKEMRNFCIQKLKGMGLTELSEDKTLPQQLYNKLLPGKGYFQTDAVGNLLVVLPSNLGLPAEETPELMYTGHMDTVRGFKKDVLPVAWVEKNGYILLEGGKGSILGADCKAAVSIFLMDIANKLSTKEKHPTLMYLLTVDEEGDFLGAKNFDKQWISNDKRHVDAMFALDHAGMPNIELYNESPYIERLQTRIGLPAQPLPTMRPDRTVEIRITGEAAHATTMVRGKSAANMMAKGLDRFLEVMKDQGVQVEIQDIESGDKAYSTVAAEAKAVLALHGSEQAIQNALSVLNTTFDAPLKAAFDPNNQNPQANWREKLQVSDIKPLQITPEKSAQLNLANTVAVKALANIPQGLLSNRRTMNQIVHSEGNDTYLGFDIRGHEQEVSDLKNTVADALNRAKQNTPAVTSTTEIMGMGPELLTSPFSKVTTLTRSIFQNLLGWKTNPEFWRTFGVSDLAYLAQGIKGVPNTGAYEHSVGYRNHHIRGTGERNEKGFSTGEYAHFGEVLASYDSLQALSERFAQPRSQLYTPQNKIEQENFTRANSRKEVQHASS